MPRKPKAQTPRGPGRPTSYTDELAEQILERLAEGQPLADICRDPAMPHRSTIYDWKDARPDFSRRLAHARDDGHDAIAQRVRQTARGKVATEGGDSTGDVQRDKLIVETDLKLLKVWDPKRYGDKVALTGGDEGDAPIRHEFAWLPSEG